MGTIMKQSTQFITQRKRTTRNTLVSILGVCLALLVISCSDTGLDSAGNETATNTLSEVESRANRLTGNSFDDFSAVTYGLDATPNGSILVTQNNTVREIHRGKVRQIMEIPAIPGAPINGVETIGRRSYFVTSGGLDLATGAGVWHVSAGRARLIGDIEAFETKNDPDATEGPKWKDLQCEEDPSQGFTAGPQSNPYHLKAVSGSEVLVADAAGNSLLSVKKNGKIDWVAVFTPPVDEQDNYRFLRPAIGNPEIDCFVQPVPTSVDIGPDGATYVGELTGSPAVPGWSRIWRIEKGAKNVTCPSEDCQVVVDGLTSVIDLEFGPDGMLYVVEYDKNGWLSAIIGNAGGGTVKRCDVGTGECEVVEGADDFVLFATAITFDKWDNLWLLENNLVAPEVRRVDISTDN